MQDSERDIFFMRQALVLAQKGRLTAPPNPWVGCVIVKQGHVIGQGFHEAPGAPHAETMALEQAGVQAQGATVYVTLEPCAHYGRTPPCCEMLIKAKVKRVVIPCLDLDPRVSGLGQKKLEAAGIEVTCGVLKQEAEKNLAPYLHHRRYGRPYCIVKIASSLDGKAATAKGESKWITSQEARLNAHLLRAQSQAILVGSHTACMDQPQLTVRGIEQPHCRPLRILLDTQSTVPLDSPLFKIDLAPTLVFSSGKAPKDYLKTLQERGIELIILPTENRLVFMLEVLAKKGVLQLLIEGGPRLQAEFFKERLVQKCCLYFGSCLLGQEGLQALQFSDISHISQAVHWTLEDVQRLGQDVRMDYHVPSVSNCV